MKTFKDIIAWKKGYQLTLLIYQHSSAFPRSEEFGLKSQIRRASVSIISNIAEGFGKASLKESIHFYSHSQASLEEVKCQSMLCYDLKYITEDEFKKITELANECGKTLCGWIKSQKKFIPS